MFGWRQVAAGKDIAGVQGLIDRRALVVGVGGAGRAWSAGWPIDKAALHAGSPLCKPTCYKCVEHTDRYYCLGIGPPACLAAAHPGWTQRRYSSIMGAIPEGTFLRGLAVPGVPVEAEVTVP